MQTDDIRLAPASLTIFDVRQLEDTLQTSLSNNQHLIIDLQQLAELDAAGMQWLMSLAQRGLIREQRLQLLEPNAFCLEQLSLMGLTELIGGENDRSN
ncbi:STAS domain-containing protein [Arsukibacterium tuosuense]|uniref:STAS domain-containing protein n=1 Tax=Arsukibacterium tuosuense TaxID=1323745 RepID=A0A285IFL9_9GAMM|nr:STAS domain-containing protein [Arsukibacterium tuosuense]SNY45886.1 STAS domain-containing protein [Arsukibacterium tuosuense]